MDNLTTLANAYGIVAATETARSVGVFSSLLERPKSADELARDIGLEPRATCRLLEALEAIGVVEGDDRGLFAVTEGARVAEALSFWELLGDRLTTGTTPVRVETAGGADGLYPKVVKSLADAQADLAKDVARELVGLGPRILDVGAGAATFSVALALADPDCRITLVDRPGVLDIARSRVAEAGIADRFSYIPGDIESHDFGSERYDLAVVGNVCHLFGDAENARLARSLFLALRPGGALALIDSMPEDYRSASEARLHALSLVLRTAAGDVHPFTSYCTWLREAGFFKIDRHRVGETAKLSIVLGRKPNVVSHQMSSR